MSRDFAVFILTHGRPDNVKTYQSLRKHGYTGKIYLVVDDLDSTREAYVKNYGDEVVVFSKRDAMAITDAGDNFGHLGAVVFARNYAFKIAENLGVTHFLELDDDYSQFRFRFDKNLDYGSSKVANLDAVFKATLDYLDVSNARTIAWAQGGDFIGGEDSIFAKKIRTKRKAMNSFFCRTDRPFKFFGRINEDVTAYVNQGSRGDLFLTTFQMTIEQEATQTNPGGLTGIYLDFGTYVKSFYSVLYNPSSVVVRAMGDRGNWRLHHLVDWNATAPKILHERFKKIS